jgi:hypothetical protein
VSQRVILHDERGLIANQGSSHDEFVIFGVPGYKNSVEAYDITDIFFKRNFDALIELGLLEFKVPGFVSRRGASLDAGTDVGPLSRKKILEVEKTGDKYEISTLKNISYSNSH